MATFPDLPRLPRPQPAGWWGVSGAGNRHRPWAYGFRRASVGVRIAMGLLIGCLVGLPRAGGADAPAPKEYEVKAAFVFNFLKFVEWSAERHAETNTPLVIGVVGKSPIMDPLEAAVRGRVINGRPLLVKAVDTPEAAQASHVLFIPASEDKQLDRWMPALAGSSVLTVGESVDFAQQGGIINFVLREGKLRFEINMNSADRAGLRVSAQLQKLAIIVRKE